MRFFLYWWGLMGASMGMVAQPPAKHVILVSVDGMRPVFYLDKNWPAPNLHYFMKEGVYADHLRSVFPAYTYPSHTAMVTGALPARSGIVHNIKNEKGEWYWYSDAIKVPTLWQALKKEGMKTAAVQWPVTVSHDITYDVPEIWSVGNPYDRITETRKFATPGLLEEIEKKATGKLDSLNMKDGCFCLDENTGRIAAYIFKAYQPALLAVHLPEVDEMEHEFGTNGDSVNIAVAMADRAIGDIWEAVKENGEMDSTALIIVGDHGFTDIHTVLRPNLLIKDLPVRFKSSGGSAFLYPSGDNTNTVIATAGGKEKIIEEIKKRIQELPGEQKKLFRIMDRKELDELGADSAAWLAIEATPGIVFSAAIPGNVGPGTSIQQSNADFMGTTKGGHHGYDPRRKEMYTGFIAIGAGIKKGGFVEEVNEVDIAPLIARLLGVPFSTPDGKLVEGILSGTK